MSTQRELVSYTLYRFIAQSPRSLAIQTDIPRASVRRVLSELVGAGLAKFTKKDMFGHPGYVSARRGR